MKIIDLLNKIANGEEVPKFWWNGCIHEVQEEIKFVEEEKKIPEKLDDFTIAVGKVDESNIEEYIQTLFNQQYEIFNKINSIIDYLKSKGE